MITISAFKSVPPFVKGFVRDVRVRWALEEAGLPYKSRLIDSKDQASPEYRALQPFGQVPCYQEDGLELFESGAIVLHIGEKSDALLPSDRAARARAVQWVFAAINSVETFVAQLAQIDFFASDQEWARLRRPSMEKQVKQRLADLAARLGGRDYLDGRFTVGDLMMSNVLRIVRDNDLETWQPALAAYRARCEARPAFQRAMAAHLADFENR